MSHITRTLGTQWVGMRRPVQALTAMLIVVVLLSAVVGAVVVIQLRDEAGISAQPASAAFQASRLDDYGLRHPTLVSGTQNSSRLDDYGLRHPVP
jgi:hypothetical protein